MVHDKSQLPAYAPFSQVPPLHFETKRLILRANQLEDLDLVFKVYAGDVVATKYMAWPRYSSPSDGVDFTTKVVNSFASKPEGGASYHWLVFRKEDGECIGGCGVGRDQGDSVSGGYIPLTIEISVFTTFKPSEGYIAKPEAEQSNTYTASKKS
jgi:RimJ/RimL family protein N-acetyltransferase